MVLSPSERLKRLSEVRRAAAEQSKAERERPRDILSQADQLQHRVDYWRERELRGWLMIEAEINECRRREDEIERDRQDRLDEDWTRR